MLADVVVGCSRAYVIPVASIYSCFCSYKMEQALPIVAVPDNRISQLGSNVTIYSTAARRVTTFSECRTCFLILNLLEKEI